MTKGRKGRMVSKKTKLSKEKESEYLLSGSENDNFHVVFEEWAKKHEKDYWCEEERNQKFKIFCASKKLVDEHNSLYPDSTLGLSYFADLHVQCGVQHEVESDELKEAKEGHDILSCSEKDELLRAVFIKWVKKEGKTYNSKTEKEERFHIFCASKRLIDKHNSLNLGKKLHLVWFSDMKVQCGATRDHYTWPVRVEGQVFQHGNENLDRLKCGLPTLFDKWQKKYGITYSSEEERNKRFEFFCAKKKKLDYLNSLGNGGEYGLNRYSDRRRFRPDRKLHKLIPSHWEDGI